jgi:NAD(P)-dependent dehydrogenase (short-subunit alcohol dehydrogenase family)
MAMTIDGTRHILVTGANKGIGKAIVERLLTEWPDTHVYLGSRDAQRGEKAVADIIQQYGNDVKGRLTLLELDTSSDDSVKNAAQNLKGKEKLYGIINNAGIGWGHSLEDTINTNYFGPRRVNEAFREHLIRPNGRIVNVASASGPNFVSKCKDNDLARKLGKPWTLEGGLKQLDDIAKNMKDAQDNYGASKALLNAYTVIHAKMDKDLVINSCTPGFIDTDLTKGNGASNPPSKGAVPPCWLMMDEQVPTMPTGRYYGSDCVRSPLHVYRGPGDDPYTGDEDLVELSSEAMAQQ